jgi:hypothetical protein
MLEGLSKLNYSIRRKDFKEGKEQKRNQQQNQEDQHEKDEQTTSSSPLTTSPSVDKITSSSSVSLQQLNSMVEQLQSAALYQQSGIEFKVIEKKSGEHIVEALSREGKLVGRLTPAQVADTISQLDRNNLAPRSVRGTLVNTSC